MLGKGLAPPCGHLLPGGNIPHTGLVVTACKAPSESSAIKVTCAMLLLLNIYQAGLMSPLTDVSCLVTILKCKGCAPAVQTECCRVSEPAVKGKKQATCGAEVQRLGIRRLNGSLEKGHGQHAIGMSFDGQLGGDLLLRAPWQHS